MANTKHNCLTRGTSGKLGDLTFCSNGQMRSRPDFSKRVLSLLQKDQGKRFLKAIDYAKMATTDPELNDFYARKAANKPGLGAWHLAISDYCRAPQIFTADFREFSGKSGDSIIIRAYDEYIVTEVMVSLVSPEGIILDEGMGSVCNFDDEWSYSFKSDVDLVPGLSFAISARDLPGNITTVSLTWPFDCRKIIEFEQPILPGTAKKRQKSQLRIRRDT